MNRCYNPKTERAASYIEKGITICDEWKNNFVNFYNWAMSSGYEEGLTIDRIDVNGNYKPSNCRWATAKKQANNRTNNRLITYNEKTLTLSEWANKYNMSEACLRYRINKWGLEKALNTPVKFYNKKRV